MASAIPRPTILYHEEQNFGWWVYALLVLMAGIGIVTALWLRPAEPAAPSPALGLQVPLAVGVGLFLPSVLVMGVLRMTTEVTPGEVCVWFGWIPTYRRSIPITELRALEVVRYAPIRDCHGWGIRNGPDGEKVYNARGDRGVRILLASGTRVLIGSQRPEELAVALDQARHAAS